MSNMMSCVAIGYKIEQAKKNQENQNDSKRIERIGVHDVDKNFYNYKAKGRPEMTINYKRLEAERKKPMTVAEVGAIFLREVEKALDGGKMTGMEILMAFRRNCHQLCNRWSNAQKEQVFTEFYPQAYNRVKARMPHGWRLGEPITY